VDEEANWVGPVNPASPGKWPVMVVAVFWQHNKKLAFCNKVSGDQTNLWRKMRRFTTDLGNMLPISLKIHGARFTLDALLCA